MFAGDVGTGPGTGQLVVRAQHWPDAVEATSNSAWLVNPSFSPNTNASLTATMEMPRIMLLQSFAACPLPPGPQWTTLRPMTSRNGVAAATSASGPPTMKVSVPAVAPPTPPDTGASTARCPAPVAISAAARASATSMVDESTNSVSGSAVGTISA